MRRDTVNYVLVGTVVLAALALLLVGLALIGGHGFATQRYLVVYRDVTGLRDGAPVFYQGYRVGQVGTVTPQHGADGTRYKVELEVRRDWPIPKDSVARLQSSGLLADVAVGIREGSSRDLLAPGAELKGEEGANVFAAMNELATEVGTLTRTQISPLIQTLSQRVDSITGALDQSTPRILEETRGLLERVNRASDALNDVLRPENRSAVAHALTEISKLSGELRKTRETLDGALGDVAGIARDNRADLRRSVEDLTGTLQALSSRMDVIMHNLESASRYVNEFSREIRQHPNRLIVAPKADKLDEGSR
ncbi:MlaD family protein [Dokdonella sp.]|uniref:MlaD family protein n=1 Tax=Dokdonella sp. TaxID=2291710 RepID=UPI001B0FD3CE|nr:MlaD family protein [Dokdonella sp.]MBO9665155.1 MCE family protein [Dokdonella sp.]